MSNYSQMIAIPRHEYTQLTTVQSARQPLNEQFYKLENDCQRNALVSDAQRSIALQSETIERMKDVKDRMRNFLTVSTPKPYRSRAESLFQSIEPYLNVNDRGELIREDGVLIPSSRYEDLLLHAVKEKRRKNFSPEGWTYFIELLKKHNVPKSMLNRETIEEMDTGMSSNTYNFKRNITASERAKYIRARSPSNRLDSTAKSSYLLKQSPPSPKSIKKTYPKKQ